METTRLSSKGQLIIPKAVREAHGWKAGTEFTVEATAAGIVLRPKRVFKRTTVDDVIGCAGYTGPRRTIEEMDQAIVAEAVRRFKRSVAE